MTRPAALASLADPDPRTRAGNAIDVINTYAEDDPLVVTARRVLADALDEIFGPLPPPPVLRRVK